MPAHEAAQSVVWFAVFIFAVIGIGIWRAGKEEDQCTKTKDRRREIR